MHPQLRVQKRKNARALTRSTGNKRHSLRNGFTVAPCSPWCTGLVSHHRPQDLRLANLTPASGCQDHTAWPSARLPPVSQRSRVHRNLSHVCDVGQRPSHRDRIGIFLEVICLVDNKNIFSRGAGQIAKSMFCFSELVICPSCHFVAARWIRRVGEGALRAVPTLQPESFGVAMVGTLNEARVRTPRWLCPPYDFSTPRHRQSAAGRTRLFCLRSRRAAQQREPTALLRVD
jgi:hypothetical protein